jgi:hypothetical protein
MEVLLGSPDGIGSINYDRRHCCVGEDEMNHEEFFIKMDSVNPFSFDHDDSDCQQYAMCNSHHQDTTKSIVVASKESDERCIAGKASFSILFILVPMDVGLVS